MWFTLYSVAGSSTLSGLVCHNGLHSDTMPVLPSDTGHTVLKLKGDPLQCFLVKLMQLYSFGTNQPKWALFPLFPWSPFPSILLPGFSFSGIPATIFCVFLILVTNFHRAVTPS